MTRTTRYKLHYLLVLAVCLILAGVVAWLLRDHIVAIIGIALLFLVPGRLSGYFWRDLYRGRRLLDAGHFEASAECFQRFIHLLVERPRLRGVWWLTWAFYTRDAKAMALNNLGAALLNLERLDEADLALQEALAVDSEYPMPHFNLAVLSAVRGDSATAEDHARTAVELGYARDAVDRVVHAASGLLARLEGQGPGAEVSPTDR